MKSSLLRKSVLWPASTPRQKSLSKGVGKLFWGASPSKSWMLTGWGWQWPAMVLIHGSWCGPAPSRAAPGPTLLLACHIQGRSSIPYIRARWKKWAQISTSLTRIYPHGQTARGKIKITNAEILLLPGRKLSGRELGNEEAFCFQLEQTAEKCPPHWAEEGEAEMASVTSNACLPN